MGKTDKYNFLVGIPTINRADLLNEALEKYFIDFFKNDIFIVDNGNQNIITREERFEIYKPNSNLGVAKSWNAILDKAVELEYPRVLILNDDIYLGKNRKDVEHLIETYYHADLIHSTKNLCSFIMTTFAYKMYGGFDENFYPAYFEDNDFKYRLKLNDAYVKETEGLNPEIYRNSMSIKKNVDLNNNFKKNEQRYIEKWGGLPNQEVFKKPFNS